MVNSVPAELDMRATKAIAKRAANDIRKSPASVLAIMQALGISRQAIWQWKVVPVERVLAVSRAIGIAPHMIRPDHYPPPAGGNS
jgi:predicted lysophospholipase L1 biosynthesis ABC-type transport system permease subunit